jgi:radical SAM superfamily enzyme
MFQKSEKLPNTQLIYFRNTTGFQSVNRRALAQGFEKVLREPGVAELCLSTRGPRKCVRE